MAIAPGTQFGPYLILSSLGSGGMGEVYKARDPRLNRLVAIKVLPASMQGDPAALARFEREAKTLAGLNHPNIVAIHDVGTADGIPFVVTELLVGDTLSALMARGPLPQARAVAITLQIAEGLVVAHDKGIIHRDLKPSNVIVGKGDHTKILDFGLAKDLGLSFADSATDAVNLPGQTLKGTILGTVGYMAPEQVRGEGADARSDLFALGVLLLEMLTGKQAFTGDSAVEVLHAILREDPLDGRKLPTELRPIIERLLAKDSAERFQTAKDLAFFLGRIEGESNAQTQPKSSRRPWLIPLIAVTSLAAGVLGHALFRRTPVCTFRQISETPSMITGAMFINENRVVFSQVDITGSEELLEVDLSRPDSPHALGVKGAQIVSVSPRGEIAVILRQDPFQSAGTLAIIPARGGVPRPVQEGITWASWGPNGKDMILHHWNYQNSNSQVIEYPKGQILFRAPYGMGMSPPVLSKDRRYLAIPISRESTDSIVLQDLTTHSQRELPYPLKQVNSVASFFWMQDTLYMIEPGSMMGPSLLYRLDDRGTWNHLSTPLPGMQDLLGISSGGRFLVAQGSINFNVRWKDLERGHERVFPNRMGGYLSGDGNHLMDLSLNFRTTEIWERENSLPWRLDGIQPCEWEPANGTLLVRANGADAKEVIVHPIGVGIPRSLPGQWQFNSFYAYRYDNGHKALVSGERLDTTQKGSWILNLDNVELSYLGEKILCGPVSPDGRWAFEASPGRVARKLISLSSGLPGTITLATDRTALVWKEDSSGFWIGPSSLGWSSRHPSYPIQLDFWRMGDVKPSPALMIEAPKGGLSRNMGVTLSADGQQFADNFITILPGHLFVVDGVGR